MVGTRGSALALAQARSIVERLSAIQPAASFEIRVIKTSGDAPDHPSRLGDGIFVKEIQRALLDREVDLAVHSLKDMPTDPVKGLLVAAIPQREDPREALVGSTLAGLAAGARVGTSSPRRMAQLRRLRPDVHVAPLRGNVPTRIEKVHSGQWDAIMLAAAGLWRLGLPADDVLDPRDVLPAPGQGALAVETTDNEPQLADMLSRIHDGPTRDCVAAERRVLRELGGGCLLPLAAYGRVEEGDRLVLDVAVTSPDGKVQIREHAEGPRADYFGIAKKAARALIARGAKTILEEPKWQNI